MWMYKDIQCPCCGKRLKEAAEKCPQCGLGGLNQLFLDKESYQRWKREVLLPRKKAWEARQAEAARNHAANMEKKERQRRNRLIADDHTLLILMGNGSLYGMGDNMGGKLGDVGMTWVDDPLLLAEHVHSAALSSDYTIYITEQGRVNLLGNGEYVDRLPVIKNAREALTRGNTFFIQTSDGKWIAFGDNDGEKIAKRTEKTIYRFQDIPYSWNSPLSIGSRGPLTDEERGVTRYYTAERCVKSTKEYHKFCEKYGEVNVCVANLEIRQGRTSGEGYTYGEEGLCSAEVVLLNRHIYAPVETITRLETIDDIDIEYYGGVFASDLGFWWEKKGGKVFLALQDAEDHFEIKKRRLITSGVKEMNTISGNWRGTPYKVILFMNDGRILYGNVDTFSKTWNLDSLNVFNP